MGTTLNEILFHGAAYGSSEEVLSSIGVIVFNRSGCCFCFCSVLLPRLKITTVFCIVPVEIAYIVCLLLITIPTKILLDGSVVKEKGSVNIH
jgi:hypothetical protein